jgi:imidazoleglycerol phosphate dehydratase HisB
MSSSSIGVHVELAERGSANVTTGLPVLDHLVGELARSARLRIALEVAPQSADEEVTAAGRAFGEAIASLLADEDIVSGRGWAIVPADEALASAALERADEARFVSNVDFSDQRVAGLATDLASRFLHELTEAAGLNLHVRLIEGQEPQHVLAAMFKAVGAALGQACRKEDS